jgi:LuxR family maltose regulon positive regulatory protein
VSRPRLTERLSAGLHRKLSLISAPAGFGKTTLLSEWIATIRNPQSATPALHPQRGASVGNRVAWLSLDRDDNDPARFLEYLIAALRTIPDLNEARFGETALAMLHASQPQPPIQLALATLVNEIDAIPKGDRSPSGGSHPPFILILDDYHLIETRQIDDALTFLLDHLPPPPRGMHLVIAGRADPSLPLSRFRAGGHMTEIRVNELRFTHDEVSAFLNQAMDLNLSPQHLADLETRTEGWIAGLQLAALAMQGEHPKHIPDFVQAFTGSHRYVVDYLVEEVLKRRPLGTRFFLLQTSILNRMTGSLCDAVTTQSGGQAILEQLEQANLFLVPLDNERRWYRYHHLFAELLYNQLVALQPDLVPILHRRASTWFEGEGLLSEAITHSLAAKDWQLAARQILQTTNEMLGRGENYTTLLRHLQTLPDEIVRASPHLAIMYAWVLAIRIQLDTVESRLREIETTAGDKLAHALRLQIKDVRAHVAVLQNDGDRAFALSRDVLEALPEDPSDDDLLQRQARMGMVFNFGHAYLFFEGNAPEAQRWYAETLALSQTAGSASLTLRAMMGLAQAQQLQGQLHRAVETCRQGLQLAKKTEQRYGRAVPAAAWVQLVLGDLLREWNKLDEAAHHLAQTIELCRRWQVGDILCAGYLFQARLRQAQGDMAGATDSIRQAEQLPQACRNVPWTGGPTSACRARLALAQALSTSDDTRPTGKRTRRHLESVQQWIQARGLAADGAVTSLSEELEYLLWVRLLIAQDQPQQALRLLGRLRKMAEDGGRTGRLIEMLALQALAQQALGHTEEALATLRRALASAEPEGYVRLFVDEGAPMAGLLRQASARGIAPDYVRKLLETFGAEMKDPDEGRRTGPAPSSSDVRRSSLVEPLSRRELQVLRLVAVGLTNREIAHELTIAVTTVKTHLKNIYAKLDVRNRTQAVARARELNLLP